MNTKPLQINILLGLLLALTTLILYWQTGEYKFIYFDDNVYVETNPYVVTGFTVENINWAFTHTYAANWHPLTWLSHILDCQLYGLEPRGHHLTNVYIHTLSTLLLFFLLLQITALSWQSFVIAALFALHPLHVESVAWVAERKDILSGFFWILTLLLYVRYVKSSNKKMYFMAIGTFVAGLMSKSMLVTLPLIMLLLDYWPLNRLKKQHPVNEGYIETSSNLPSLVIEKIPFLFFSLLSSVITIYAQNSGTSLVSLTEIPFTLRLENAIFAYTLYIIKIFMPYDLAVFYPFRTLPLWQAVVSLLLISVISQQIYIIRNRFPYLLIGWLWFLITLLPVIGLVQVGDQSMADRYTYLPSIGLFIMFSYGITDLGKKWKCHKIAAPLIATTVIITCVFLTNHQLAYWKNDTALFTHAINVTQNNYKIHDALGVVLAKQGHFEEAFRHFSTAISIIPNAIIPYYDMGIALESSGRGNEASRYYLKILSMDPDHVGAHTQLGGILCRNGQFKDALNHFYTAIQLAPDYYPARSDLNNCIKISDKQ